MGSACNFGATEPDFSLKLNKQPSMIQRRITSNHSNIEMMNSSSSIMKSRMQKLPPSSASMHAKRDQGN